MKSSVSFVLGIVFVSIFVAGSAAAGNAEEKLGTNWDDAVLYADLVDTFFNDDNLQMAIYYDEGQNILWGQPASEPIDAAAEVFPWGAEYASGLDFVQYLVPTSLWLCHKDEDVDEDNCSDGHKWATGDISYWSTVGTTIRYQALNPDCLYQDIERVRATGTSSTTDYCDANYRGYYYDSGWFTAEDFWCTEFTIHTYGIDDSTGIVDFEYDTSDSQVPVVRFRYHIPGGVDYNYMEIWLARCD